MAEGVKDKIIPMLEVSTAHLTKETNEAIQARFDRGYGDEDDNLPVIYAKDEYGYFIPVRERDLVPTACPADLLAIIDLARGNGCGYVMLDKHSEEVEGLSVHEW